MSEYRATKEQMAGLGLKPHWGNVLIIDEALKRGVEVTVESGGPRIMLRRGSRKFRWFRGRNTLNHPLARKIGAYKELQSRLLLNAGIGAPENAVFAPGEADRAWRWAEHMAPLVVKPHRGTHGANVHVDLRNREEFDQAFEAVAQARGQVLVEKFHTGIEHRCLVVNNRLVAATRRRPASVEGDGKLTVKELVAQKNSTRGDFHFKLRLEDKQLRQLARQGMAADSVPAPGERAYLAGTSNVHTGGDAIDATDDITADERGVIERAVRAIPGLKVVGLDVLLPRSPEHSAQTIIEINSAPMIAMHHFPWEGSSRDAAGAVLDAMFPETARS